MSSKLDIITLTGLSAHGTHGVFDFERDAAQPFTADVSLWVDTQGAFHTDSITDTVSYADVAADVVSVLAGPPANLIETLAHRIAETVLARDLVEGVQVTVHKPQAPLEQEFSDISVTVRHGITSSVDGVELHEHELVLADDDYAAPLVTVMTSDIPALSDESFSDRVSVTVLPPQQGAHHGTRSAVRERSVGALPKRRSLRRKAQREEKPKQMRRAVLALGGNQGNVPQTLASVVSTLVDIPDITVLDVSPLLRTRPVLSSQQAPQNDYWNAVVLIDTSYEVHELLECTQALEEEYGRVRTEHWGPRTVDIDIIQVGFLRVDDEKLTLPHPQAAQRAFVLYPWLLIEPEAELIGRGRVEDLAAAAPDQEGIVDAVADWLETASDIQAGSDLMLAQKDHPGAPQPVPQTVEQQSSQTLPPSVPRSRLDLLPEASRVNLAPKDDDDGDLLWHQLWLRWNSSSVSNNSDEVLDDGKSAAPPRGRGEANSPTPEKGIFGTPTPEVEKEERRVARAATSLPSRRDFHRRTVPTSESIFEKKNEEQSSTSQPVQLHRAQAPEAPLSRRYGRGFSRALPQWDFARTDVTIVDDLPDVSSERSSDSSSRTPQESPTETAILDPNLPAGTPIGALETPSLPQASFVRRVTVRPTATGALRMLRHQGSDSS
ncbi:MAG: hypothetical protein CSA82_00880 [Actinobacteria bacterium]|nr:MAG: hypothetical protein CSA82_00880 [Actinomycetota bacterium]